MNLQTELEAARQKVKELESRIEKEQQEFLSTEIMQVRDYEGGVWNLSSFDSKDNSGTHPFYCGDTPYKYCRRPVDVPGVLVRWMGGECPVSDGNKRVLAFLRGGGCCIDVANIHQWNHKGVYGDIIAYMIIPDWLEI